KKNHKPNHEESTKYRSNEKKKNRNNNHHIRRKFVTSETISTLTLENRLRWQEVEKYKKTNTNIIPAKSKNLSLLRNGRQLFSGISTLIANRLGPNTFPLPNRLRSWLLDLNCLVNWLLFIVGSAWLNQLNWAD
ncbi:Unknown protein, partial [Striga hermonthica]